MCFSCVVGVLGSETGKQDRVEKQGDVVEGGFFFLNWKPFNLPKDRTYFKVRGLDI